MDPVPLGLALVLVAIIIYLFKELGESRRDLASAERRIEDLQRMFAEVRPDRDVTPPKAIGGRRQDGPAIEAARSPLIDVEARAAG
ncbi:MAG: hypothetical protein ACK4MF_06615 [Hyphomicrobiaceae bacterium]